MCLFVFLPCESEHEYSRGHAGGAKRRYPFTTAMLYYLIHLSEMRYERWERLLTRSCFNPFDTILDILWARPGVSLTARQGCNTFRLTLVLYSRGLSCIELQHVSYVTGSQDSPERPDHFHTRASNAICVWTLHES